MRTMSIVELLLLPNFVFSTISPGIPSGVKFPGNDAALEAVIENFLSASYIHKSLQKEN